jgi:hypothetical protein
MGEQRASEKRVNVPMSGESELVVVELVLFKHLEGTDAAWKEFGGVEVSSCPFDTSAV